MTVTIDLGPELEGELRDQAAREGLDANSLIVNALRQHLRQRRRAAPRPSKKETELLLKINAGLPEETWRRYHALVDRRKAETLTQGEHTELIYLSKSGGGRQRAPYRASHGTRRTPPDDPGSRDGVTGHFAAPLCLRRR